jgi:hypothetical protein
MRALKSFNFWGGLTSCSFQAQSPSTKSNLEKSVQPPVSCRWTFCVEYCYIILCYWRKVFIFPFYVQTCRIFFFVFMVIVFFCLFKFFFSFILFAFLPCSNYNWCETILDIVFKLPFLKISFPVSLFIGDISPMALFVHK